MPFKLKKGSVVQFLAIQKTLSIPQTAPRKDILTPPPPDLQPQQLVIRGVVAEVPAVLIPAERGILY